MGSLFKYHKIFVSANSKAEKLFKKHKNAINKKVEQFKKQLRDRLNQWKANPPRMLSLGNHGNELSLLTSDVTYFDFTEHRRISTEELVISTNHHSRPMNLSLAFP